MSFLASVLPALAALPAGAAAQMSCASQGTVLTFSPPLPMFGDPTTVVSTITGTETFSGCTGLGVASGTMTSTFTRSTPINCDWLTHNFFGWDGTFQMNWDTGQTSGLSGTFPDEYSVDTGLFTGARISAGDSAVFNTPGWCTSPLTTISHVWNGPYTLTLPTGTVGCGGSQACNTTAARSASATYAGSVVTATGTPARGAATIDLRVALGTLKCPNVPTIVRPIANLRDTFARTDRLKVTATLPYASSTARELVCFNSEVPFLNDASPKIAKAGTGFLLDCSQTANVAPCVQSSKQVENDIVVQFVVPGGDPRFYIALPKGRQVWLSRFGPGKVGTAFRAQLQMSGGTVPVRWSIVSGTLPKGCALNPNTGAITGKPAARGKYTVVVKAADSSRPPKTVTMSVPIIIK